MSLQTSRNTDGRSLRAKQQRTKRKSEILVAAQQVIGKQGFANTSITDVLKAAKISRGTFYLYFESREILFHELLDGFIAELKKTIKPIIDKGDPLTELHDNIVRALGLIFDKRDLSVILLREAVGQTKVVDEKLMHLYSFLYRMLGAALRNGIRLGITRKVDDKMLAIAIVGSFKEIIYEKLMSNDAADPSQIAQELIHFCLKGLLA